MVIGKGVLERQTRGLEFLFSTFGFRFEKYCSVGFYFFLLRIVCASPKVTLNPYSPSTTALDKHRTSSSGEIALSLERVQGAGPGGSAEDHDG